MCTCSWISSLSKFGHGSSRPALQAWTPLFVAVAGRFKPTWGTVRIAGASGKPPEWKIRRENGGEFRAEKTKLGRWERCFNFHHQPQTMASYLQVIFFKLYATLKSIHCSLVSDWELMTGTGNPWIMNGFGSLALLEDETGGYVGSTKWLLPFLSRNWKKLKKLEYS